MPASKSYFCRMEIRQVEDLIFAHFPYQPTEGQRILILALAEFLLNRQTQEAFLFKGYAGTGKTTVLSALVKAAPDLKQKTVLLALAAGLPAALPVTESTSTRILSMSQFEYSAPAKVLDQKFGFTVENVFAQAMDLLKK